MKLKDKVAIVTGSSSGIGRAVALALAREGAKVVVNYSRSEENAHKVVNEIKAIGSEAFAIKADVSKPDDVAKMVDATLNTYGSIDILVNNAGIYRKAALNELTEEIWDKVIDVNLKGIFLCCKAVADEMLKKKRGWIVNISSTAGMYASPRSPAYSAAKAGIIAFTKSIAEWFAPYVQVNAVAGGWIETRMSASLPVETKRKIIEQTPLRRFGLPEEIARIVLFLVSEEHFMTGQVLIADGGLGNVNWVG